MLNLVGSFGFLLYSAKSSALQNLLAALALAAAALASSDISGSLLMHSYPQGAASHYLVPRD